MATQTMIMTTTTDDNDDDYGNETATERDTENAFGVVYTLLFLGT
jgi:hypothetical protein